MTAFAYRAARPDGGPVSGTVTAPSAAAALDLLGERGLFPIEVRPEARSARSQVGAAELAPALSGLAALLEAGLPVDRALSALEAESGAEGSTLARALAHAQGAVREGTSLSRALETSGVIPAAVLGYVKAGERTGRLAAAVAHAAEDLERAAETQAKIRAALTYPAFLAVAGTISVAAIAGFVVPRFAALLAEHGQALPWTTRALLAASAILTKAGIPLLLAATMGALAFRSWARTENGRHALDAWLLGLPIIGALRLRFATARAAGALAGLLGAGVPMLAALDLARAAAADSALGTRLAAARTDVERGERVSAALARHAALSPAGLRLAAFGERAGTLPAFLAHAARLEDRTAQRALQRLVALLEPLLILAFGALVAFVAAALLQAVYSVRPGSLR